ncbi:MAG: elongation factor 4 [Candidatus Chisholmbacteria bacterium]|nr:elongation factor 4 [Candidatus Chisholmbacteria bacterium]
MAVPIRNFAIISHIDHGKTTLTDRLLELTHSLNSRHRTDRLLDSNPIERERGITIKLAPVRMIYHAQIPNFKHQILNKSQIKNSNNQNRLGFRNLDLGFADSEYILNLIDTPGHADFSYEVERTLAACEGAILLVDATQGIQAQTLATAQRALDHNLVLIPVVNKIDVASAEPEKVAEQMQLTLGFTKKEIIPISAKVGTNVEKLLAAIVERLPGPKGESRKPLQSLVFNSHFDEHQGVIVSVRVFEGLCKPGDTLKFFATNTSFRALEVGVHTPSRESKPQLSAGEVGYIATGLKDVNLARVGDTIVHHPSETQPLPGYREPKPVVFTELYPLDSGDFPRLKEALAKLKLNDAALKFEASSSKALGHGIRVGFLGLLHAEIVQERLEREYDLDLIATTPIVNYEITLQSGEIKPIRSATDFPSVDQIHTIKEPYVTATILSPATYIGSLLSLAQKHRATLTDQKYLGSQIQYIYELPLSELLSGFYDELKSATSGFASLDYDLSDYQPVDATKVDIIINHEPIPPLSTIIVKDQAEAVGRRLVEKLKDILPRQQFEIPIQAAISGKIVARATVKAFRKDVTAKLYGGDQTRKDKLLKKQKKGKKRLKAFGKVAIPQEAFLAVLKS